LINAKAGETMIDKYQHLINKYHHRFMDERLEPYRLSGPVAGYLMGIFCHQPLKMNVLISQFPFHKSHATRTVQALCDAGYVVKTTDPDDARGFILSLTDSGREAARRVIEADREWENLIDGALSPEEKAAYQRLTEKVWRHVAAYYSEDPQHEETV
jgi:DNA-binding MarR family transcriptional regulator